MTWILRFLFFVLLFYLVRSILSHLFGRSSGSRARIHHDTRARGTPIKTFKREVLRDPQCGTYVDRELAVPAESSEGTLYFCSEECRRAYMNSRVEEKVSR